MNTPLGASDVSNSLDVETIVRQINELASEIETANNWDMQATEVRHVHDKIVGLLDRAAVELASGPKHDFMMRDDLRRRLIRLNARLHSATEIALAKRFLAAASTNDPFVGSWINRGFTNLLAGQVAQWQRCGVIDRSQTRIAIVGGGALPQTQVFLSRALGCATVSVERDDEAAQLSREILARANISDARVELADGCDYDYSHVSIVVVATLVQQKAVLAKQVARTHSQATFAPRAPIGTHAMWREAIDPTLMADAGWQLLDVWAPENSTVASHAYRHVTA